MNLERLLISRVSELILNIEKRYFGEHLHIHIVSSSLINERDTLIPGGNKYLFYFKSSITNKKQTWGFYVRKHKWRSILWRI